MRFTLRNRKKSWQIVLFDVFLPQAITEPERRGIIIDTQEKYIKSAELAALFGVDASYINTLAKDKVIPYYRFRPNGHFFFKLSEVEKAVRFETGSVVVVE